MYIKTLPSKKKKKTNMQTIIQTTIKDLKQSNWKIHGT
jgi:hypothetical protein